MIKPLIVLPCIVAGMFSVLYSQTVFSGGSRIGNGVHYSTAISFISQASAQSTNCVADAVTNTGPPDTTGASLIVLAVASGASGANVSDSKGNTWVPVPSGEYTYGGIYIKMYYALHPTVGASHIFNGTGICASVAMIAFSGGSVIDTNTGQAGNQPGTISPSINGEALVCATVHNAAFVSGIDSGFTITGSGGLVGGQAYGFGMAYLIQTTAAPVNPQWTYPATSDATGVVAFKP